MKFGIVGPFSGGSALNGVQWKQGIDAWLALNSDTINGRKIEIIYRDTASGNPAVAKQLSQELLVQDKVDVLGGYALSPEAAGVAPLIDETKTPTLLFHVASPVLAPGRSWRRLRRHRRRACLYDRQVSFAAVSPHYWLFSIGFLLIAVVMSGKNGLIGIVEGAAQAWGKIKDLPARKT